MALYSASALDLATAFVFWLANLLGHLQEIHNEVDLMPAREPTQSASANVAISKCPWEEK